MNSNHGKSNSGSGSGSLNSFNFDLGEIKIMKHLPKHQNVVTLKDTYEDGEAVPIVMELCEGGELFDRIVA